MRTMSLNEEPDLDPRIAVYNVGSGEFITHFWDEETGTEATAYFITEAFNDRPLVERLAHRVKRSTEEEIRKSFEDVLDGNEIDDFLGVTDANRRVVPRSKIASAVYGQGGRALIDQINQLRLPGDYEIDNIIDAIQHGLVARSNVPELRSTRDLKGRWKELRAVEAYLIAKVWKLDPAPAVAVQQALELDNVTQARNLIQRAREHKYIERTSSANDLRILDAAFDMSRELRRLSDEVSEQLGE